jgi:MFS family permease
MSCHGGPIAAFSADEVAAVTSAASTTDSSTLDSSTTAPSGPDVTAAVQRHTLRVLIASQVIGGVGVAIGIAVGALLTARMGGTGISGLGQSALVVGAALLALPVSRITRARGRRPGLVFAYAVGVLGAVVILVGAARGSVPLVIGGLLLFGGGNAGNYQARYAAVDLAAPARRARQLSWVVWATTIGAVAGPNLAPLADSVAHGFGAATYSGPFAFSAAAFLLAGLIIATLLRPDPLLVARAHSADPVDTPRGAGLVAAVREVRSSPAARLGIAAVAVGHAVMVGVMAMTPVHIGEAMHGDTLRIVGVELSVHIAGMYAVSPVTGWLTDRLGRRPVILVGIALLLGACAVAGTAGHDVVLLSLGLVMLGLGWSATMVAGSTLLSESVGTANKPSVQGLSDLVMGLAGAVSGGLSGLVVAWASYGALTALAAVLTVPLIALTLRPIRVGAVAGVE